MQSTASASGPRLGLSLAPSNALSIHDLIDVAKSADEAGIDSLWLPETWGYDAAALLAVLARETERIKLASGVFNVFSRSAALIAQTAATLQELSDGRFTLGLGTSGPAVIERWHGVVYDRPVERTREYVNVIRMALSGAPVDFDGDLLELHGFRLATSAKQHVPIYIAALGPQNTRMTGEVADGWLPIFAPRGHLSSLRVQLERGAKSAGRDPRDIDIAAYVPFLMGPRSERLLRQQLAYYIGGMGTFYTRFISRLGFASEAERIRERWQSGDRTGAVAAVDDSLLDLCTLGNSSEQAGSRLVEYRAEGLHLPIVALPHGCTLSEALTSLRAVAGR